MPERSAGPADGPSAGPADELAALLGGALPPSVAALPADVLHRLIGQVRATRSRQDAEIERALRAALTGVPLPVRGVVRRAVLG